MKRFVFLSLLIATPAFAQTPGPTVEDMQAQWLIETGQLRQALGTTQQQLTAVKKELADARKAAELKKEDAAK